MQARPDDFEKTFRRLLRSARPIEIEPAQAVARIINNGFKKARYFEASGIVFVLSEDEKTVLSCEHKSMWRKERPMACAPKPKPKPGK